MSTKIYTDNFPDVIRFEPSGLCNFRCIHCPNRQKMNSRLMASEEMFDTLIKQFRQNNYVPRVMVFYHGGEPLLNKKTPLFIKKAKIFGVSKTKIVTNGSLLNDEVSSLLVDSGLDELEVSFDGNSPEENNSIRVNGNFEKDSKNVLHLLEVIETKNANLKVGISNVQILRKSLIEGGGYLSIDIPKYLKDRFYKYLDKIFINVFPAMIWPDFNQSASLLKTVFVQKMDKMCYCPMAFESLTILANGDVTICCYDLRGTNIFGNIKRQSIFDIWNSSEFVEYRSSIRNSTPKDFCKKCLMYKREYLCY